MDDAINWDKEFPTRAQDAQTADLESIISLVPQASEDDSIRRFIDMIYPPSDGDAQRYLLIWTRRDSACHWFRLSDRQKLAETIKRLAETDDVYFQTSLMPSALGSDKRGTEEQAIYCHGVPIDIDIYHPLAHKGTNLPTTFEEAEKALAAFPLKLTVQMQSGHGIQGHWLFDTPYEMPDAETRARIKQLRENVQKIIRANMATKGWKLDSTHDLVRILRVGGTWNRKTGEAVPVTWAETGPRYTLEDLEAAVVAAPPPPDEEDIFEPVPPVKLPAKAQPQAHKLMTFEEAQTVPVGDRVARCRAYLEKCPSAISGQGGHGFTLRAAAECFRFGLSDEEAAQMMQWWNQHKCEPAWSDKELAHKIKDGKKKCGAEFGSRLTPATNAKPADQEIKTPKGNDDLILVAASSLTEKDVDWLWDSRIALGTLTLLAGYEGSGKSYLSHYLTGCITSGAPLPFDDRPTEPGNVIYLSAEEDAERVTLKRLKQCGARLDRVHFLQGFKVNGERRSITLLHLDKIERAIKQVSNVKMVVIDPVLSYLDKNDSHADQEVRDVLMPMKELAEKYQFACKLISHVNKAGGKTGVSALDRVMGSRAFTATVRNVLFAIPDTKPNDSHVYLTHTKGNLGRKQPTLAYTISDVGIDFDAVTYEFSAEELLARFSKGREGTKDDKRKSAIEFLKIVLSAGPVAAIRVKELADAAGHSLATVKRAKRELYLMSRRDKYQGEVVWELPNYSGSATKGDF